jgi:hypothetical protein
MNVSRIKTPFRGAQWRQQFADSMISMCPELNPDAIDEMADAEYSVSSDLEPETAARSYAVSHRFIPTLGTPAPDEPAATKVPHVRQG